MRLPRVRFSVRGMMVVVAIVGFSAWSAKMLKLSAHYHQLRELHATKGRSFRQEAATLSERYRKLQVDGYAMLPAIHGRRSVGRMHEFGFRAFKEWFRNQLEDAERRSDHYGALEAKYERAARYPWLPVAPDPPEPK
jgi:hypothetical protein